MRKRGFLPFLLFVVFVVLFIGSRIMTKDFSNMPLNVVMLIGAAVALVMNRRETFSKKIDIFMKHAGHPNIILMAVIFLLAGVFAGVAKGMGAVESTVNLGLSLLPTNLLIVGLFVIGGFISISMGTSMDTIVVLAPIGVGIADQTGISVALAMATVIIGAMFRDNLSMISDTTIAAVRTQQTKFKVNFFRVRY
ncbi:Na+/H+ antiporter NhaC family protein [Sporosarcina sp. P37]|uniref:Na+/H+ antiporter NhaC family protein n=1 Tax=Sporosarcina sp. P37 TaxID=1930546 RepID=UPI0030025E12